MPQPTEFCLWATGETYFFHIQWNPDFTSLQEKRKLVRKIREFEKSGVKLQCSTEKGKQLLV